MGVTRELQQSVETENNSGRSLKVKLKAGASIVKIKPLFTHDSKFLIVATHCDLKVFSIASGDCFKTLKGHTSPIVSIQENKKNQLQVLSCSEDGTVIRWDYMSGTAVKVYNLKLKSKVSAFYAPLTNGSLFVSTKIESTDSHRLYRVATTGCRILKKTVVMKPVHPDPKTVGFGVEGKFIAAVYGNNLQLFDNITKSYKRHKTGERELLCVACHPSEYCVATGDVTGRILVWADMLITNNPARSIYHWHTLPVGDLAFSVEGSYIYSGGGEAVLVKWNLKSESRRFLPRLGLPICSVVTSHDNSMVATSHIDNAVQIISAQNRVIQIIQGFTSSHLHGVMNNKPASTGLLYDPRTSSIVTNGRPGHLQFYKIHEDKQLFNLNIVDKNIRSQERKTVIINTDVDKAALDHRGTWLATIETRDDGQTSSEIFLKFWKFELETQKFALSTDVFLPHYMKVNCIKFRPPFTNSKNPYPPMAVTTSDDKQFKLWILNTFKSGDKDMTSWTCESVGEYRNLCPGDISFSEDGSVLAVAFGHVATLWMPDDIMLKATFFQTKSQNNIQQLIFGRNKCSHLLVCHSGSLLTVWNVLTLTVMWNIRCDVQHIVEDPSSEVMIAFTKDNSMFVFRPNDPKPVTCFQHVSDTPVVSAIFIPKYHPAPADKQTQNNTWLQNSEIYFLNESQELKTICEEYDEEDLNSKAEDVPAKTIFSLLQAEHKKSEAKLMVGQFPETEEINKGIFKTQVYQNPTVLCKTLIPSLLLKIKINQMEENVKDDHHPIKNYDSSSEDEPDTPCKGKTSVQRDHGVLSSEEMKMEVEDCHSNENIIEDFGFLTKFLNMENVNS